MSIFKEIESRKFQPEFLQQGAKARVKYTGQIVELKQVSDYGISVVSFCAGYDYFISNRFLEPVSVLH